MKNVFTIELKEASTQAFSKTGKPRVIKYNNIIAPPVPSEETIARLNAIAKQPPFCFYYREKENDFL